MTATSRAAAVLAGALLVAGCGGGAAGLDQPPPSLDPSSPTLAASGVAFETDELKVAANRAFVVVFENRESLSHNVSIYADETHRQRLFEGALFSGPASRWYPVPALAPGTYVFACDLHPNMTGRLVAS